MTGPPLLEVDGLRVELATEGGPVEVASGVSFSLARGETLALVGESGCGKTVTALSILRLLDPPLRLAGGAIRFDGRDLATLPERELRRVRGARIAMVFQEPGTALNPVLKVGDQIGEGLLVHGIAGRREARARTLDLMREVGIADPARRIDEYPHQMSGGMRQRVMLAMALACAPDLLIADEPTTALDVTIQAQILALLRALGERRGMAMLLITHDLGVVAETANRVAVMYAGKIVEHAPVARLFDAPAHPYTRALFRARPRADGKGGETRAIPGAVPEPGRFPRGCRFHPRCDEAFDRCAREEPELLAWEDGGVACFAREREGRR